MKVIIKNGSLFLEDCFAKKHPLHAFLGKKIIEIKTVDGILIKENHGIEVLFIPEKFSFVISFFRRESISFPENTNQVNYFLKNLREVNDPLGRNQRLTISARKLEEIEPVGIII